MFFSFTCSNFVIYQVDLVERRVFFGLLGGIVGLGVVSHIFRRGISLMIDDEFHSPRQLCTKLKLADISFVVAIRSLFGNACHLCLL